MQVSTYVSPFFESLNPLATTSKLSPWPARLGKFTRRRVRNVVPHRVSSCRTTHGLLFARGLESVCHRWDRWPLRCLPKVLVARPLLLSARECARKQTLQRLRPFRAGRQQTHRRHIALPYQWTDKIDAGCLRSETEPGCLPGDRSGH